MNNPDFDKYLETLNDDELRELAEGIEADAYLASIEFHEMNLL